MTDPAPLPPLPPQSPIDKLIGAIASIPAGIALLITFARSPEGQKWAITIGLLATLATSVWNGCAHTAQINAVHADVQATKDIQSKAIAVEVRGTPSDVAALKQVVTQNAAATQPTVGASSQPGK